MQQDESALSSFQKELMELCEAVPMQAKRINSQYVDPSGQTAFTTCDHLLIHVTIFSYTTGWGVCAHVSDLATADGSRKFSCEVFVN